MLVVQFKIIHRIYATPSYVSNFDMNVNKTCAHCESVNNLAHVFAECIKVKLFWICFEAWLNNIENVQIKLTTSDIIFGLHKKFDFLYNFCILHAKWWIHLNREEDQLVNFYHFKIYLKKTINIEKQIALNKSTLCVFNKNDDVIERSLAEMEF